MKIPGHKPRRFDRYDITSEEDWAEASRKLQAPGKNLVVARDRIELSTLRFSVVCSTN